MKKNIVKNVTFGTSEKMIKYFPKLKAVGTDAQVMLTTKRLILFTMGNAQSKGKRVKRKMMNEIQLSSIHRFEYYEEIKKFPILVRLIAMLFFAADVVLFYMYFTSKFAIPTYPYQSIYTDYGIIGVIALISLYLVFHQSSSLYMKIRSGLQETTLVHLVSNKYNNLAVRYLAGKLNSNETR